MLLLATPNGTAPVVVVGCGVGLGSAALMMSVFGRRRRIRCGRRDATGGGAQRCDCIVHGRGRHQCGHIVGDLLRNGGDFWSMVTGADAAAAERCFRASQRSRLAVGAPAIGSAVVIRMMVAGDIVVVVVGTVAMLLG